MRQPSEWSDASERAALYAAGAMPEEERCAYEHRLAEGCPLSNAETAGLAPVVESLSELASPVSPPQRVWDALSARIESHERPASESRPQVWRSWASTRTGDDMVVVRRSDGDWEETGVPGVRIRRLFVDRARNQFTGIVQMDPGTAYPRHVHDGPEECLVLRGQLRVGDALVLNEGDYQYAPPGSLHGIQSTERGCLLLITSSLSDEMV